MFYTQREIRMAGCDPLNTGNFGITTANANAITFTEDIRGSAVGNPPDGILQASEKITYSRSSGNLVRNVGGGNQPVVQNIDALDFVYLNGSSPPVVLNPGGGNVAAGSLSTIRSVEITIVARINRGLLPSINNNTYLNQQGTQILGPQNDNLSRRRLTTFIKCRNLGL